MLPRFFQNKVDKRTDNLYNTLACIKARKNISTGGENNANIQPVSKKGTSDCS